MNCPTVRSIPLSPGRCWHFEEGGQDKPCLRAETFEHQYFIAKTNYIAVYKSHRAVCSFIEVVQNTYGTASQSQGGQARSRGNTQHPPRGRGFGAGGRQEAAPASGSQELPSCASWAAGLEELHASHTHTQAASSPPSPAPATSPSPWSVVPVLEPGKAPRPPGNSDRWEKQKISAGMKRLKKRWRQEQQKVPLWLVFPTMIKTSIAAPARAISGREFWRGRLAGSAPHEHSRAMLLLLPASLPAALNTRGSTGQGLGCRAGGGWISKMYKFASSIYNQ